MTSQIQTLGQVAEFFTEARIRDVECVYPDANGVPRGKRMPAAAFATGADLRIASAISMQAITGEYPDTPLFPDEDPDIRLVPDLSTVRRLPWSPASAPRALVLHDAFELDGRPCDFAPRSVLRAVLARYAAKGLSPVVAPEIEFYLTAPSADAGQPYQAPLGRDGQRENGQSAFGLASLSEHGAFWDELGATLEGLGVRCDTWIHEMGLSQFEINLVHGDALALADQAFLFKLATREVAARHGMRANFMAKPLAGQPGSSMHLHQSVVDRAGRNIFSDREGGESAQFHQYIAGLQAYLPDVSLVFAPYVNSYRRFLKGSQAPVSFVWGHNNRTAGLRVPESPPQARRVENRVAGADANPYLVVAASLAAGLAGLELELPATAAVEGNAYDDIHADAAPRLPRTLAAAIERFSERATAGRLFGERFAQGFAALKDCEHEHWLREIGAWERRFLELA